MSEPHSRPTSSDSSQLPSPDVKAYWDSKATPRFSLLDHLSSRSSVQELTAARHAIDNDLSALDAIMRRMRARRNDFTPISRLPPEILCLIFDFHAINKPPLGRDHDYYWRGRKHRDRDCNRNPYRNLPWGPPSSTGMTPVQLALGWLTILHVSRHWRKVALSNNYLWEMIAFDLSVECVLSVSGKGPLATLLHEFPMRSETDTEDGESLDEAFENVSTSSSFLPPRPHKPPAKSALEEVLSTFYYKSKQGIPCRMTLSNL